MSRSAEIAPNGASDWRGRAPRRRSLLRPEPGVVAAGA